MFRFNKKKVGQFETEYLKKLHKNKKMYYKSLLLL